MVNSSIVKLILIPVCTLFLIGCGGVKETLKDEVLILVADSLITEAEWNVLKAFVKEKKAPLKNSKIDCFSDSMLRVFVLITLSENGYPIDGDRVWKKPEVKIGKVKFYLETSASMGGYYRAYPSPFVKNINDLITNLELQESELEVFTMYSKDSLERKTELRNFKMDLASAKIARGKSSELHEIFKKIGKETREDEISFFVSDGIMSFPSNKIKSDRELNRRLINNLKNDIKITMSGLSDKGLAVLMYAFTSNFTGSYYPYTNYVQTYNAAERPYYIWCMGDSEMLKKLQVKLESWREFRPAQKLELGMHQKSEAEPIIFTRLNKLGDWSCAGDNVLQELSWNEPTQFTVGLNLSDLPMHARQPQYLLDNLNVVDSKGFELELVEVLETDEVRQGHWEELKPEEQGLASDEITHFIVYKITGVSLPSGIATIELKRNTDDWVGAWSNLDDRDVNKNQGSTWGFEHLVSGMKDGFGAFNQRYVSFEIEFNK